MRAPSQGRGSILARQGMRLLATLTVLLLALPSLNMVLAQSASNPQRGTNPQVTGQGVKDAFLGRNQNLSSVGTLHSLVVPRPQSSRRNDTNNGDPPIYNQFYSGAYGFESSGTYQYLYSAITFVNFGGTASSLEGATMSAGLGMHVPNSEYQIDYLFVLYAYVTPSGQENVAYAAYSACAGPVYNCGPAFSYCGGCIAFNTIVNGTVTDVGNLNSKVGLTIHWDSNLANTGVGGYVFDYQDVTTLGNAWWTAVDVCPNSPGEWFCPANENDVGMSSDALNLGYVTCSTSNPGVCENDPVDAAYFFQVGFMISQSNLPTDSNWRMYANDTQYTLASNGGAGSSYYLNHATVVPWSIVQGERYNEWSYWKELWLVSGNSAALNGVSIYGGGSSSMNYVYTKYTGGEQNPYQLW